VKLTKEIRKAINFLSVNILKIPQGVFYSNNHMWTHLEKSGNASVGLDDLLLHITGEVQIKYLKNADETVKKGDLLAEIHHEDRHLKLYSPISGKIIFTNPLLFEQPELINEEPFDGGWICKIKPSNWQTETISYHLADDATDWTKNEIDKLKDFLALRTEKYSPEASMVIMQDGGELTDNLLSAMPAEIWVDFQREFMDPD